VVATVPFSSVDPAASADYLTTLRTRELQQIMRDTTSLPLDVLLNHHGVRVDLAHRRVWRDAFWKGSFSRSHVLGWDERLLTPRPADGSPYAGGRFWKRFDAVQGDVLVGHIVNYNVHLLPGKPIVKEVSYPDDRRRYFKAGDRVLLLTYTNQPYRIVYDAIKAVGPDTCIGVMHLGTFPRGLEFATFVMSRNNYPFDNMTVPDHDRLFDDAAGTAGTAETLEGRWKGRLVWVKRPDLTLHNQFNPPVVSAHFHARAQPAGDIRVGWSRKPLTPMANSPVGLRFDAGQGVIHDLRLIDRDMLIGRRHDSQASQSPITLRYVLSRR
jgi:hypothetical protein